MKRLKLLTIPASSSACPEKKQCLPVVQFIPVQNISVASPLLEINTENAVNLQISQNVTENVNENVVYSVVEHMNITEPLTTLRALIENRLGFSLADYTFYLQDVQELDASKNLVNQCVQGEGLVQINADISSKQGVKKINIVDVLKPAEEIALTVSSDAQNSNGSADSADSSSSNTESSGNVQTTLRPEPENITRWIAASDFRQLQDSLKIPQDPVDWTEEHVRLWLRWAATRFMSSSINVGNWKFDGKSLMSLTREGFRRKVPIDPGDLFWTHLELLRKCKIVAVLQQPVDCSPKIMGPKSRPKVTKPVGPKINYDGLSVGNNNGQIQLWQFLLELLTDKDHRDHIQWVGTQGEFKLINPEMVAHLWGRRKNKPTMNYEKLSRALRYYYDGEMIAKVHGKRFVYKFVCDLKSLLGYSAAELNRLVCECEMKSLQKGSASSQTSLSEQ